VPARIATLRRSSPSVGPQVPTLIAAEFPIIAVEATLAAMTSFTLVGALGLPWSRGGGRAHDRDRNGRRPVLRGVGGRRPALVAPCALAGARAQYGPRAIARTRVVAASVTIPA
jgi:hypothetical protein